MNPWLLRRLPRPEAPLRMYCLAHSGGSPGEYLMWAERLPDVEVWGLQLPGHGARMMEPAHTAMPELVADLVAGVDFTAPYVLFGHSLGAAIAYEVAVALRERGAALPTALVLSSFAAPGRHRSTELAHLDEAVLLASLEEQFGPLPDELRDDPDWLEMTVETLRADLRIVDSYRPTETDPLPCPLLVLGGSADDTVTETDLAAWRPRTTDDFRLHLLPGGHFYFREDSDDFHTYLADQLRRLAGGAVPGSAALGSAAPVS
ncbi:MAG: thioesterase [Actinobacteria bacterium]|nr:thioesterase [Actinomycetota bacterium]